jgi:hypothetical protein
MQKNVERTPSAKVHGGLKVRKGAKGRASGTAAAVGGKKGVKTAVMTKVAVAHSEQINAVLEAAGRSGFLGEKTGRISGRINPALLKQAKRRTGIKTDTDLIEFALANVALEDNFAEAFKRSRGTVDRDLKLGF